MFISIEVFGAAYDRKYLITDSELGRIEYDPKVQPQGFATAIVLTYVQKGLHVYCPFRRYIDYALRKHIYANLRQVKEAIDYTFCIYNAFGNGIYSYVKPDIISELNIVKERLLMYTNRLTLASRINKHVQFH